MKWIGLLTAASLLMTGITPVLAQEAEEPVEIVQEAVSDDAAEEVFVIEDAAEEEAAPAAEAEDAAAEDAAAENEDAVLPAEEDAASAEEVEEESETEAVEAEEEEELLKEEEEKGTPSVSYRTHVQSIGWQDFRKDGAMAGTSGQSKRLEAIEIKVEGVEGLGISYRTHIQTYGWRGYASDGQPAGTTGQSKRLEAIQIKLTGEAAADYDVYYCVHVQTYGWLNWAKNDEIAGTAGYSKRLEGICIKVLPKGEAAPAPLGTCSVAAYYGDIEYCTHAQTYGWMGYVKNGATSGTTGQSKRLEAIRIRFSNTNLGGFVQYRTHVQGLGWQTDPYFNGPDQVSGTVGQSRRLEAIQIRLWGDIEKEYDIWYRTHVQKYGWSGWAKNGASCGSEGISYRMEAIQIKLLPKGSPAPGNTSNTLFTKRYEDAAGEVLLARAAQYVDSITNASMSKERKLRICFDSFANFQEKLVYFPVYSAADWPQVYAKHFFDYKSGDCLTYAAAFAYMAKAIGYDNVYCLNSTGHGWAEINGLIYDPEYSLHASDLYGTPYSAVPAYQNVRNAASSKNTYRMKI